MEKNFRKIILLLFTLGLGAVLFAQDRSAVRISSASASSVSDSVLGDAYNAYAEGDYQSAMFLFRRALTDRKNQSDNALYMLIMTGMHLGEYKAAYADSEYFLSAYPESVYAPIIKYQQGRALFYLGDYDNALIVLGDFCHEYPDNMMYASALFWIGECFYAGYNFDQAEPFYMRVVTDFPKEQKAIDAQYRLDVINARKREQKLLYMLQETGESYLSSKENYEKTLRRYELENSLGAKKLSANNSNVEDSVEQDSDIVIFEDGNVQALPAQIEQESENAESIVSDIDSELLRLKASALEAELLLNQREGK